MSLPLSGRAILVTRPEHQAGELAQRIEAAGGEAVRFPALEIVAVKPPADLVRARLTPADRVIFISPNAARIGLELVRASGARLPARVIAVGGGTARALREGGVTDVVVPSGAAQDSEAVLALSCLDDVAGERIVIVRGVGGRELLAEALRARGATVDYLECYRRQRPRADAAPLLARWAGGGIDAVTAASSETLAHLATLLGAAGAARLAHTPLFVPHAKIAAAARRMGIDTVTVTAGGDAGLVEGLINWFQNDNA
jgi:uroporphyrinogen-III synthase